MLYGFRGEHANFPFGLMKNSFWLINVACVSPNLEMRHNLFVNNFFQVEQPELRISQSVRAGHDGLVYAETVIYTKLFNEVSP